MEENLHHLPRSGSNLFETYTATAWFVTPLPPPLLNVDVLHVVQDLRHWAPSPKTRILNIKKGGARGGGICGARTKATWV